MGFEPAQGQEPDGQLAANRRLERYCFACHGPDTQEANVRFDQLDLRGNDPRAGDTLQRALDLIQRGKMPPEDAEAPSEHERSRIASWLNDRLDELTNIARQSRAGTRRRRLTTEEYHFTLQSLFAVDAEFADLLPADSIAITGYRNDAERLGLSSLQIEAYLDSARRAVGRYVQFKEFDERPLRYHIELEHLYYSTASRYETRQQAPSPLDFDTWLDRRASNAAATPAYVDPLGPMLPGAHTEDEALRAAIPKLNQQYVAIPERLAVGEMLVRVRAAGTAGRDGRFPRMRVEAGITLGDGCSMNKRLLGEVDVAAPLDKPATYVFRIRAEDVPTKGPLKDEDSFDRLSVFDMDQLFISNVASDPQAIFGIGRGGYANPAEGSARIAESLRQITDAGCNLLHLDCLEIEMFPGVGADNRPYRWQAPSGDQRVGQQAESDRVGEFLEPFMRQAYRRPIAAEEIEAKLGLFRSFRQREYPFEESLRETLAAVLVSPSFLFIELNPEAGGPELTAPAAHQLASRLSYFLWLSPPDELLMKHADDGSIREPQVLKSEAERLLADPKARRFLESFCRQWLRLDKHSNVAVNRRLYPAYDEDLAALSVQETLAYFVEVFANDRSALDLIDSNYAMLNSRLADHYEVANVIDGNLHRVELPEHSVRGGLLTQASVLTMNSDGVDSHPIRRGVWLLERILHSPPPPPPPNVPEIDKGDANLQGLTLKERIELHRQPGACRNCHLKIDPWGIPFEELDAIGRWRTKVESQTDGKVEWKPVDAASQLPGSERITGVVELKNHLRQECAEPFAESLVYHMVTYALGRPPDFADRQQIAEIQQRFARSHYRLRELVLAIVENPLFRGQVESITIR